MNAARIAIAAVVFGTSPGALLASPFESGIAVRIETAPGAPSEGRRRAIALACKRVADRFGEKRRAWKINARQAASTDAFVARTGRARFEAAAVTSNGTLWLQPENALGRWPGLDQVFEHECVHLYLRSSGIPPLPIALEETLAIGISGGASRLAKMEPLDRVGLKRASEILTRPKSKATLEVAVCSVVSTVWPALRGLRGSALLSYLKRVAHREAGLDWALVPLGNGAKLLPRR